MLITAIIAVIPITALFAGCTTQTNTGETGTPIGATPTDEATGLIWSQADSGTGMDWEETLTWVQVKNAENYPDHSVTDNSHHNQP